MKQFFAADYAEKYISLSKEYDRLVACDLEDTEASRKLLSMVQVKMEEILETVHREGIHRQFQQEMKRRGR